MRTPRNNPRSPLPMLVVLLCVVATPVDLMGAEPEGGTSFAAATAAAKVDRLAISASCASAGCHGASSGSAWQTAYQVWSTRDPHADAYRVLLRTSSKKMVAKLNGGQLPEGQQYKEFVNKHCATCHSSGMELAMVSADPTPPTQIELLAGVSCQACHGAADTWLDLHVETNPPAMARAQVIGVSQLSWTYSDEVYGLRQLDDGLTRARTCVACHVGSPGSETSPRREVNHDLIAAGHPRLAFEYTSHLANLPPHWEESTSPETGADPWVVGQLVSADAAIELLAARTEAGVWPEFSEYSCASCHHHLRGVDTRLPATSAAPRTATYDWGSWYYSHVAASIADGQHLSGELEHLSSAMSRLLPVKAEVRKAAGSVQWQLRQAIARLPTSANDDGLPGRVKSLASGSSESMLWDSAVQHYLWYAHRQQNDAALATLFQLLDPPSRQDGPLWMHYQPHDIRQLFRQLDTQTNNQP